MNKTSDSSITELDAEIDMLLHKRMELDLAVERLERAAELEKKIASLEFEIEIKKTNKRIASLNRKIKKMEAEM